MCLACPPVRVASVPFYIIVLYNMILVPALATMTMCVQCAWQSLHHIKYMGKTGRRKPAD